jgi:hypothetical protein
VTVLDLLTESSIMNGSLAQGEDLPPAEAAYLFSKLNQMVDMWASDRLAIYRSQRAGPFSLVSGTQSYAIGAGATWDVARPVWIDDAGIIQTTVTPNTELPMRILTKREWAQVGVKTIQSTLPRSLWYDQTFPNGTIYLYPVPSYANQIVLYIPIAVTEFAALTDAISLPPGYRMALVSNLAVLGAMGIRTLGADVEGLAVRSYGNIKAANLVENMDPLECDAGLMPERSGVFDWMTGDLT